MIDQPPRLVVLAGPNGAGKSTYYELYLCRLGLYFLSADILAMTLGLSDAEAAKTADELRGVMMNSGESFVTETVFSDPVGAKLQFMLDAVAAGYEVTLIYIGLDSAELSEARVVSRVLEGGHDVPSEMLPARYVRSLGNLKKALGVLPHVVVFDNSRRDEPFVQVYEARSGKIVFPAQSLPAWFQRVLEA